MRWFALLLVASSCFCQSLEQRIRAVLNSSPAVRSAFWGVQVEALDSGRVLFSLNSGRLFVPASNTKLFTSALALARLGPDYRFRTKVLCDSKPDGNGEIKGNLTLYGGGDPSLSARTIPYVRGPVAGNPLAPIEELADQLAARGVRRIEGDIAGDDTWYVWAPYADGWSEDDTVWDYGAPASALNIGENFIAIWLRPTRPGEAASVSLSPALEYYTIDNRVTTTASGERRIFLERLPGTRQLRIWGAAPMDHAGAPPVLVAMDDPALYAAYALRDALTRRGITVTGRAITKHRYPNEIPDLKQSPLPPQPPQGFLLGERVSPPLVELLRVLDKVSHNLYAEVMLREVGRARRNIGTREAGLEEMRAFVASVGIPDSECNFQDGSGLSRLNLVSPAAVLKLLAYMHRGPFRDAWICLLPIGAKDGTLETRFASRPGAARIRAKTGTLTHASALSGYADSKSRGPLAFAVFANNYNAPAFEIQSAIDKIGMLLTQ